MENGQAHVLESGETPLACRRWLPAEPVAAVVAYLHGVGGHSGQPTFRYLIDVLVADGCAVHGLDLRGHGRSGGRRGHVDRWEDHLYDVSRFLAAVRGERQDVPLFLFGQSLGGLIALEYAIAVDTNLNGVIVSAPALALPNVPRWIPPVLRTSAKIAPKLPVNLSLDLSAFTRDRDEVAKLEADPLRHTKVTARFAVEFEAAVNRVQADARRLAVPLLIVVGEADAVTPTHGTEAFFENVSVSDKTLKTYPGGYHQPILDTNRDQVLADIATWIGVHRSSTR